MPILFDQAVTGVGNVRHADCLLCLVDLSVIEDVMQLDGLGSRHAQHRHTQ